MAVVKPHVDVSRDQAVSADTVASVAGRPWVMITAAVVVLLAALALLEGGQETGQATVNGLVSGTYFALGAVGLALVFGVLRLVNFAHGDMLTFGAYACFLFNVTIGIPIVLATFIALAATAVLGVLSEFILWRPMRAKHAGVFQIMLVAIGLSFLLRNTIQLIAGASPRTLGVNVTSSVELIGGVRIGRTQLVVVLIGLVVLLLVGMLLRWTQTGRRMRALSDDIALAEVSGIDTRRIIVVTWLIAGGLAGLAGVLSGAAIGVMTPNFGFLLLLSLFAATVLGGIGSAYGALAGGLLLGLVEEWSTLLIDPRWKVAVGFAVLVLTLILRPNGLLGRPALR